VGASAFDGEAWEKRAGGQGGTYGEEEKERKKKTCKGSFAGLTSPSILQFPILSGR